MGLRRGRISGCRIGIFGGVLGTSAGGRSGFCGRWRTGIGGG